MTQLKLDKIIMTSLVDTYINYDTLTTLITVSGTVGAGASATFSGSIPYTRTKTRADLYAYNQLTGKKRPITGGVRQAPYSAKSTETFSQTATYNGSTITITFTVFNGTGASVTLNTQIIEVSAVLYEVPY